MSSEPDGIDPGAVEQWLSERVPELEPPLNYERVAGGRSNLTYIVRDASDLGLVLRRPPLGKALGSAHDMNREFSCMDALAGSAVPVPPVVGLCQDESVIGADFYVMRFVEGTVIRDREIAEATLDEAQRRSVSESLVDTLAALHAIEPDDVGLGDLGRREHYVERQLRRWMRQWEDSKTRELPEMEETHRLLSDAVPEQQGVAIVHGDYRLDNAIASPDGRSIAAVVDWELCTLGDPLADLGLLYVYWSEPGDDLLPLPHSPTLAPGFPARQELVDRYAAATGLDVSQLDFYVALGLWKLAAVLEGVYARYAKGAYGSAAEEFEGFKAITDALARAALEHART
jgi:aminoglycoside phosphotransferase (APT) family kinase protein